MKKEYIRPEMKVEQFMAELAFLTVSGPQIGGEVEGEIDESNSHRGTWGNLWD